MTGVGLLGIPGGTNDDYRMSLMYESFRGNGDKNLDGHPLTPNHQLVLMAREELERLDMKKDPLDQFDKNGARLVTLIYNFPESIEKDLEINDYGITPSSPGLFPYLDSFYITGKLDGIDVGFGIDFFPANIQPTGARTFIDPSKQSLVHKLAEEIYLFRNAQGKSAYAGVDTENSVIDLSQYMGEQGIKCSVCDGELKFGFEGGKLHKEIILEMMGFVNKHPHFTSERYILKYYDFKIDFSSKDGEEKFKEGYGKLAERVQKVFKEKAKKRHIA